MIKLAFIYKPNNPYLCGLRPNNNFKKFYMDALHRNPDVHVSYIGSDTELDCKDLSNKYDVYLFFDTIEWGIPVLRNIDCLKGLRIASINDAHSYGAVSKEFNRTRKQMLFDMGINYCYYQHTPDYFHKFYPEVENYWWIPIGFDAELYKDVKPWKDRRGDKILLTGVLGTEYYGFRELCKKHPNVEYVKPGSYEKYRYKKSKNDGDNYKKLLEQYKFAIASGYDVANKYFEIPAAGCYCIAHIDEGNGCDIIGFDPCKCARTNEYDYFEVLDEVLMLHDNFVEITAQKGRDFVFQNYTHDKCVERLIDHIKAVL